MSQDRPFRFAVAPTLGADLEDGRYRPVQEYLAASLGRPVTIVIPESYEDVLDRFRAGELDAAMVGEVASKRAAERGEIEYLVAPTQHDAQAQTYTSAFITPATSGIATLGDLRGRRIAMVDSQSTSGYIVPRAMLREHGIDPDRDVTIVLVGTHRTVGEAVAAGSVDAGAGHENLLGGNRNFRTVARSRPIPKGPLVVRSSLGGKMRARLADALLTVHERHPEAARSLMRQGNRFTLTPTKGNATLKSIATLAGVSYATVSRVVNGSGYVAAGTAQRVRAIVEEYGYAPNGHARMLMGRTPAMVGIVPPTTGCDLAALAPLLDALHRKNVPAVVCPVTVTVAASPWPAMLRDRRLGCLLVDSSFTDDSTIRALRNDELDARLGEWASLDREAMDALVLSLGSPALRAPS